MNKNEDYSCLKMWRSCIIILDIHRIYSICNIIYFISLLFETLRVINFYNISNVYNENNDINYRRKYTNGICVW